MDEITFPNSVYSVCPHDCPSTCALSVERLLSTRIGRVHGAKSNPYTAGVVCAKVARYADRQHHPDRLTQPLIRTGDKGVGRQAFEPIGWDQALDLVAEAFTQTAQRSGSEAIWPYFFAGTMGLLQRDGIDRFRHAGNYSGQIMSICTTIQQAGWEVGIGERRGVDALEIEHSDVIVMWGGNPVSTQVNLMTHISKARKNRNAKLVVVDVYDSPTAKQADVFLCVKPSTDGALAAAVAHCLVRDGKVDRAYLDKLSDFDDEMEKHFLSVDLQQAAETCGVSVNEIEAFANLLGGTKKCFFRLGYGFSRARNGAQAVHAVTCLPTLIGAWQVKGGGALHAQAGRFKLDVGLIKGSDLRDPNIRSLDMCRIGPVLTGDKTDLGDGPLVEAMLIQNVNPVNVAPDLGKVIAGFNRDDLFTCVHEQFMTETAAMADVVLPATTFLEHPDIYLASAHMDLQVAKAVIEPLGDCKSNHWVICQLAKRLGFEHAGFELDDWQMVDAVLQASNFPSADQVHEEEGFGTRLSFDEDHFLNGFPNPTGKFRFYADWKQIGSFSGGLNEKPGHADVFDKVSEAFPFRLVTSPARSYLNTSFTETPKSREREGRPTVFIHQLAAERLGIKTGDLVTLSNRLGSVRLHALCLEADGTKQDPQTLVVESIWPNADFVDGIGINLLISADVGLPNRGGVFHDTAVSLTMN